MFFIWGSRQTEKIAGTVNRPFTCKNCRNITPYQIVKEVVWFTFYFIPTIPLSISYRAECPICKFNFSIEKQRAKENLKDLKSD